MYTDAQRSELTLQLVSDNSKQLTVSVLAMWSQVAVTFYAQSALNQFMLETWLMLMCQCVN